jgi:uncharacterized membrane protein
MAALNKFDETIFSARLTPYRSLEPRRLRLVLLAVGAASSVLSLPFFLLGAWPVIGFLGLDVLLVYWAFRINYRHARLREELRLTEDSLTVERVSIYGERRRWQFQPFWLRVTLEEKDDDTNRLVLDSHGRALVVGSFLGPAERRGVASALKDALSRWRARLTA